MNDTPTSGPDGTDEVDSDSSDGSGTNRRGFLHATGAAAAVGAAGLAVAKTHGGSGFSRSGTSRVADGSKPPSIEDEPIVVHVRDASKGEISVMTSEGEVISNDKELVHHLSRALRQAR